MEPSSGGAYATQSSFLFPGDLCYSAPVRLSPGCQAVRCCQVICRAVGQLSGTVRCLCQTSCRVLSVLSGAVGCVSDIRGDL